MRLLIAGAGLVALTSCFGDGTHLVGNGSTRVKPGIYTTSITAGGYCYWERLRDTSGEFSGIIANDITSGGRVFLQVAPTDRAVSSSGCGSWDTPKAGSYNPNRATMKFGDYRVPTDVVPGTYSTSGSAYCYWERLSGWSGDFSTIIASGGGPGTQVVTIASTDAGFSSTDCAGWKGIGP